MVRIYPLYPVCDAVLSDSSSVCIHLDQSKIILSCDVQICTFMVGTQYRISIVNHKL